MKRCRLTVSRIGGQRFYSGYRISRKGIGMQQINVMIVDDEQLVLDNLKYLLNSFQQIHIVAEITDSCRAVQYIKDGTSKIDAIFMDISMPKMSGIEAAKKIYKLNPVIRIIFLTAF